MKLWQDLRTTAEARRQYFSLGRAEIARDNLVTMQIAGSVGAVVSCIFFVIAPVIIPSWSITIEYMLVIPILAAAFLFAFFYARRRSEPDPRVVEAACAIFYLLVLADLIALSVFPYPGTPQIFVSLCFMFMPVLLIQRPAMLLALMAVGEAAFLLLAANFKTGFSLENDIFNTIAALFFSFVVMAITNRLRYRNFGALNKLEKLSQTDALTGLLNKQAFEDLSAAWLRSPEAAQGCVLLVMDLDDFKLVNDDHGHPFGDAMLAQVGQVLLSSFRQSDLVGRIGGDEFAVLLRGSCDPALLERKCAELRRCFAELVVEGRAFPSSCSMGAAIGSQEPRGYGELFRQADAELYRAKRERKNGTAKPPENGG